MKKTWIYLIVLLIVAGLTWYFVFREETEVFDTREANFTIKDTAEVTAIFLSNLRNENIKLTKTGTGWILNDSFNPRRDALELLLTTLKTQKPEMEVSVAYHDEVIRDLSANHTKVEVYNAKGKTHTFYVGKNPGPNNVTYMLNENAKRPYVVKLPLQNTFVGVRYFTRLNEWRDKKILFADAPIEWVSVQYKDSVQYSFRLTIGDGQVKVSGNNADKGNLNHTRVNSYLKLLDGLYCMGFEEQYIRKDSIVNYGRQLAQVQLKRRGYPEEELTLYFKPVRQGTKSTLKIGKEEYDFDVFLALLNQRDFILISRKTAEKILRSFPEFYAE